MRVGGNHKVNGEELRKGCPMLPAKEEVERKVAFSRSKTKLSLSGYLSNQGKVAGCN